MQGKGRVCLARAGALAASIGTGPSGAAPRHETRGDERLTCILLLFACLSPLQSTPDIDALKHDVESFAKRFPTIGFDKAAMRYKN